MDPVSDRVSPGADREVPVGKAASGALIESCAASGIQVEVGRVPDLSGSILVRREQESEAARSVARKLLAGQGVRDALIPRHADGFPLWPAGWVGSLTHSAGACAAAVARSSAVRAVGVDLEDVARMKPELWAHILTPTELQRVGAREGADAARWATEIFCAKEAVFKAIYPLWRLAPGFRETEIEWGRDGRFDVTLATVKVAGRCGEFDGFVLAVAWVAIG